MDVNKIKELPDGTRTQTGNTRSKNETIFREWFYGIEKVAPWQKRYDENGKNVHTIVRHGFAALSLYLSAFINNRMCQGYTEYHHSSVNPDHIQRADKRISRKYHISRRAKYYEFQKPLSLTLTGDGASNVKNLRSTDHGLQLAFLKPNTFDYELMQNRHAGVCVLISALRNNTQEVANCVQQISDDLGNRGTIAVWCEVLQCYLCFQYRKFATGDWAWQHKVHQLAVSPGGEYNCVGGAVWNPESQRFEGLAKKEFYKRLVGNHIQPYEDTDIKDAQENNETFSTLTTNEIAHGWAEQIEEQIEQDKQDYPQKKWTERNVEHKQRLKRATEQKHGILYLGKGNVYEFEGGVFDICHCMWSIVVGIVTLLIMLMWCVWRWDPRDVLHVIHCLGSPSVTVDVLYWMTETNRRRNPNIWIKLSTSGLINRVMLNSLHHALLDASEKAEQYLHSRADSNKVPLLILSVFWRVCGLMREGFGVLFTAKFEKKFEYPDRENDDTKDDNDDNDNNNDNSNDNNNDNNDDNNSDDEDYLIYVRPPQIVRMIECFQLATFIAYHLFSIMVCLHSQCLYHVLYHILYHVLYHVLYPYLCFIRYSYLIIGGNWYWLAFGVLIGMFFWIQKGIVLQYTCKNAWKDG